MAFTVPVAPPNTRQLRRPPLLQKWPSQPHRISRTKRARMVITSPTSVIKSSYWDWGTFGKVHYRHAGTSGPIVLFIPGFGCGAFHFEDNVTALAQDGFRVYALDKLGLGNSTVASEAIASEMTLATWRDQIIAFIEDVLQSEQVFLAGNSLGGLLTASVCATRPDLTRGAILLNAAPFWVAVPSAAPSALRSALGAVVDAWWGRLTNARVVRATLQLVYASADAVDDKLVNNILRPTERLSSRTVFRSVLLAPPLAPHAELDGAARTAFADNAVPVALINGAKDPWVGPVWAMRFKHAVPDATLYELDPVGHCPHAEAPAAVDFLLAEWVRSVVDGRPPPTFGSAHVPFGIGGVSVITKRAPNSILQRLAIVDNIYWTFLLATLESAF